MRTRPIRTAAGVGTAIALALGASGCGGSDDPEAVAPPADEQPTVTEITYWTWTAGAQDSVDAFNASQDEVQVTLEEIPGGADGYTKIASAVQAGNAPDVVTIEYPRLPEFASQGQLEDLTGVLGDTVEEKFPAGVANLVNLGGSTWGVPYDAAPQLFYYRKDLFEQAGIEVPETWDDFKTAAETIRAEHPDSWITNFGTNDANTVASLAYQAGMNWFTVDGDAWKVTVDNPATRQVAEYWDSLLAGGLVSEIAPWSEEEDKARLDGTLWGIIGASWSAGGLSVKMPDMAGQWAAAPLPNWGTPAVGMAGGTSFTVPKGSENIDAAAVFIDWVTSDPAAVEARLASATSPSSTLPANAEARSAGAVAYDTSWLGGQDLFALAGEQADTAIVDGWAWGPVYEVTKNAMKDAAASGTFAASLAVGQAAAEQAITDRGLSLSE